MLFLNKSLHNRIFNSLEETMDRVCIGLKDLESKPEYIKSMTNFPHLNVVF